MSDMPRYEYWKKGLVDVGAWDHALVGVPAGGVQELIEEFGTLERELAACRAELERGYQQLELRGVPRERAKSIGNGIDVLATRYEKESRLASPPPDREAEGLADAARQLLDAFEMHETNEAIAHGAKGRPWDGNFVRQEMLNAAEKVRVALRSRSPQQKGGG